jgi:hypothetical protein
MLCTYISRANMPYATCIFDPIYRYTFTYIYTSNTYMSIHEFIHTYTDILYTLYTYIHIDMHKHTYIQDINTDYLTI